MKLIDKDALVAEIEKRLEELNPKKGEIMGRPLRSVNPKTFPRESELEKLLLSLDTLEVKEVDLEKELIEWHKEHFKKDGTFTRMSGFYLTNNSQIEIAKHFFELGLSVSNKAQKGE